MNKKQMSIAFGSKKQTDRWIFKVCVNGTQFASRSKIGQWISSIRVPFQA